MPTFIPIVQYQKKDGTSNISIKVTHKRKRRYLKTAIYVTSADLTRNGKIKSESIKDSVQDIIQQYRRKCLALGLKINAMEVDAVVEYLTLVQDEFIDFFDFGQKVAGEYESKGKKGSAANIRAALNSLKRFSGSEKLDINQISARYLKSYEEWLRVTPVGRTDTPVKGRAISLYMGTFKALINEAKSRFNDEEQGLIQVKVSPFTKYKIPDQPVTKKRALSIETIRLIRDLEIDEKNIRMNLSRDCFMLSFYLAGINAADLYTCSKIEKDIITYNRQKTTGRRRDKAEMKIRVEPEAMELFEKYRDPSGSRVFKFYHLYSTINNFNAALNKGLKQVGAEIGVPDLTFYAARHSWATIAVNDCGIDKYLVHEALNHVDETMRMTDIYIARDFSRIWEANKKNLILLEMQ